MRFRLHHADGVEDIEVPVSVIVIAGWSGRDEAAVQEHIDELREIGVAPPSQTPLYYRVGASLATQADRIQVLGEGGSGEAEAVLIGSARHGMLVAVGSDHTDREFEAQSVAVSKQMCPKPLGHDVWRCADVAARWDRLRLESDMDGEPYQRGTMAAVREPVELIADYFQGYKTVPPEFAMFLGTIPAIGGVRPGKRFSARLADDGTGRALTLDYETVTLPIVS